MKKKKVLTATVNDNDMMALSSEIAQTFPREHRVALGLFTAILMAEIFIDEHEAEEMNEDAYHETYNVGDWCIIIKQIPGSKPRLILHRNSTLITDRTFSSIHDAYNTAFSIMLTAY